MSTIRANPTAPIAMPTLAPILRPLESLEVIISGTFVLLAGDGEAVEVEGSATDLLTGPDDVVEDVLDSIGNSDPAGSGLFDTVVPSAVGIGDQAVVKIATPLVQVMSISYVLKDVSGAITVVELLSVLELQLLSFGEHGDGVTLKLLARLPYA
jgi:hypothetical protein